MESLLPATHHTERWSSVICTARTRRSFTSSDIREQAPHLAICLHKPQCQARSSAKKASLERRQMPCYRTVLQLSHLCRVQTNSRLFSLSLAHLRNHLCCRSSVESTLRMFGS